METSKLLSSQFSLKPFIGGADMIAGSPIERTFDRNQVIYIMGARAAALYLIVSGRVKVSLLSEQGREKILYLLGEGEVFGELSLINDERTDMAMACEPTTVRVIGSDRVRALIERDGQFALRFAQLLCHRLALLQAEIESHAFYPVKRRLTKALWGLAEKFGVRRNGDVYIVGVTHEALAQLLGICRETVTFSMLSLAAEHVVSYRRGLISIREDLLQQRVGPGHPVLAQRVSREGISAFGPDTMAAGAR